jgi:hypothetical protein
MASNRMSPGSKNFYPLNNYCVLLSVTFDMVSFRVFFLRDIFTAHATSPPVETAPATTNPTVAKQNGHMVHLYASNA